MVYKGATVVSAFVLLLIFFSCIWNLLWLLLCYVLIWPQAMGFLRRVWPKHQLADKVAFCFMHVGLVGMFLFELLVVLPKYHQRFSFMYNLHVTVGVFMAAQVFTNMYKMLFVNDTIKNTSLMLPSVLHPGWFYCPNCQLNSPPRSHHCPICDVCVLKRDHHCVFTGNCVGYANHRYFIAMCFYLWMGCFYSLMFNWEFFGSVLGSFDLIIFVKLFFPMVAWTLGYVTIYQLAVLIITGITLMAMFLFSCLVIFQVFFISRGQTQFEYKKKISDYRSHFAENWKTVLGERWYLVPFSAYFSSRLPGDGMNFVKCTFDIDMSPVAAGSKTL